jgi:hypothetical protein
MDPKTISFEKEKKELKKAFNKIKKEFEEHLDAINENTSEIQSNYELLLKLEGRMDKIENSISEINRFIQQFKSQNLYFIDDQEANSFTITPLSEEEKHVFKTIYELEAEGVKISYDSIADNVGISTSLAREYVSSMIEKGVPIIKNYLNQRVFLSLEPKFKDLQTKKNIVKI